MTTFNLVNIWTDSEPGRAAFSPMPASLLWTPDDHAAGYSAPAFIFVHGWGAYPYDPLALSIAPDLANHGFCFLSVCMRRRGLEGQLNAMPDDDIRDIKVTVDYLHNMGCQSICIIGHEIGALSVMRYHARTGDSRVDGIALIEPPQDAASWLQTMAGAERYGDAITRATIAARQGAGMDTRFDFPTDRGAVIAQNAAALLTWWGTPASDEMQRLLAESNLPALLLSPADHDIPDTWSERPAERVQHRTVDASGVAQEILSWAQDEFASVDEHVTSELVETRSADADLFGILWSMPTAGTDTVTLLMHGLSSSPLSPLFAKMGPVLARGGSDALAIETRRSGYQGHETALLDDDLEDIDAWIEFLLARGYRKIVLAGASMGSLSVGRHHSLRRHPNVVALAHLMPTADCPDWFRRAAGDGPYASATATAQAAVAAGTGAETLIDVDVRQPPPSLFGSRFRWTQRAASWLSWWGPDADSCNSVHIANADVPVLLLSGTDDSYNDIARFAELRAAAVKAPSIDERWYENVDHGLGGAEQRTATDCIDWLRKIGVLSAA